MLKYTGSANYEKLSIRMFGDGYSKDVSIDLSKPPFNLKFTGFYPKNVVVSNVSPGMTKTVILSGDLLTIIFTEAPPLTEFPPEVTGPPESKLAFDVYFVYGTGVSE